MTTLHTLEGIMIREIKITSESEGDYFSKNDLFAKITIGDQTKKTSTKWDQNICTWNEYIFFPTKWEENKVEKTMLVEIMDEDTWGPDQKINSINLKVDLKESEQVVRKQGVQIKMSVVSVMDSKKFIAREISSVKSEKENEKLKRALHALHNKVQTLENSLIEIKGIVSAASDRLAMDHSP